MKRYELYKEAEFTNYLVNECNTSIGTAKSYISCINSISIELDIEKEFYSEIAIEASAVTYLDEILGLLAVVREFSKSEKTRKNWMSGLKAYIDFRNKAFIYGSYDFAKIEQPKVECTIKFSKEEQDKAILEIKQRIMDEGVDFSEIMDNLTKMLSEETLPDRRAEFSECGDTMSISIIKDETPMLITDDVEDKFTCYDDLTPYKVDKIRKTKITKTREELAKIFKSRFSTQNRKYSNGTCYMPTIFAKIEKGFFAQNIETQISNIKTWIKPNGDDYQCINVAEFDKITIQEGDLYGYVGKNSELLYFKYNENSFSTFKYFICGMRTVTLGHTKSVWRVLNDSEKKWPTFNEISKIILCSGYDVKDIKLKSYSDAIAKTIKAASINIEKLRFELKEIDAELTCELMPSKINIAMGKN